MSKNKTLSFRTPRDSAGEDLLLAYSDTDDDHDTTANRHSRESP
jgi:hypothetical protein